MHHYPSYLGGPEATDSSSRPLRVRWENVIIQEYTMEISDRKSSQVAKCHRNLENASGEKSTDDDPLARVEIGTNMGSHL